ncbi:MAG TPA: ABC transporter permease [Polyangiaceae bacterium]|nr:ABC transporter permease [Polyangiaceae bacterium]
MRDAKRLREIGVIAPVALLFAVSAGFVLLSQRSPSRLSLELSWSAPSASFPFGNGDAGVDLLALVCHATLRVLVLATGVAGFGFLIGAPLGAAAGLTGGSFERWTLRACDLVQSFPTFLLALAVLSAVSVPSRGHIAFVFALTAWAPFARIAAARARSLRDAQFVEAARALGVSRTRTLTRHVLPNLLGPVAAQAGTSAAGVVLGETALGFVGLGPPDGVSLGALLEQGTLAMLRAPHVLTLAVLAIALVSGGLQLASEGLRRWVRGDAL